ncbi:MAG: glucose-1-phosphate adenylyltransferase subunit GlgD [Clostridiales bacterium]|nr:glucose-1-phosphate adenylyltransferase subunit GlgD [Clostridiales bacterium]
MIREAFGIIYAAEEVPDLRELVEARAVGALPVGGKYRMIDFGLSNMINSEIRNVGVIASRNYNSLMDHLSSGKPWDLSRKSDGLFLLTPFSLRENPGVYRGKVEALKSCLDYIRRTKQEYCVLTGSTLIFNNTFDEMMRFHIDQHADVTILYQDIPAADHRGDRFAEVYLDIEKDGTVTGIELNPAHSDLFARNMETYIIGKDTLIYMVEESFAKGEYQFCEELLRNNIGRSKIMAFEHKGYVGTMRSVAAYYKINMDLLNAEVRDELFSSKNRIYTKVRDSVPAKYTMTADVSGSLIANGCIIEGKVENSVLFRSVHVGRDTVVKNSIIFPGTDISEDAELENVILDKNVSVRARNRLIGAVDFPVVIRKGSVV